MVILKSPYQAVNYIVKSRFEEVFKTYDSSLPPTGTPYPFSYIGEQQSNGYAMAKRKRGFEVTQTVHVYNNEPQKRGYLLNLVDSVLLKCEETGNGAIEFVNASVQTLVDDTTDVDLLHVVIDLTYRVY